MIAKEGWFRRRKYTGWGFTPVTWQGWAYIAVLILPFVLMTALKPSAETQIVVTAVWAVVIVASLFDIMKSIKKDERDMLHEAIAERNALWIIVTILALGVAYQAARGIVLKVVEIDPVILIALAGGLIAKAATNLYFDRKD